jgi:hypothetical protein
MAIKCALAIAAGVGVVVTATAASAAKKHPRYVRPRAPAVVAPAPSWNYGPAYVIRPRPNVPPYACIQDEGYGRWTYCGQGATVN